MHSLECENNVVGSSVQAHRRQDGVRSHASLLKCQPTWCPKITPAAFSFTLLRGYATSPSSS